MVSLIIDTSTERGLVVFAKGKDVLLAKELEIGYRSSTYLMPAISEGFDSLKLKVQDLSSVAVGIGPGSYTGIRVGVSVAKAISFAKNLPLVGFCGLKALVSEIKSHYIALLDAKVSGFYLVKGDVIDVSSVEGLKDFLYGVDTVVTTNSTIIKPKIEPLFPDLKWEEKGLNAEKLAFMVQDKLDRKEYVLDGHLELLYLRKTQVEER